MRMRIVGLVMFFFLGQQLFAEQTSSLPKGWIEVFPGGDTICARGKPFSFFVAQGSTDKVVVDYIGGGACWNDYTCDSISATFTDSVDEVRNHVKKGLRGIYDRTNPNNPVKDWTHVVIPYCTGDIHWGNNTVEYKNSVGKHFKIHHKGAVNAKAVKDWVAQNILKPKNLLVTGCSAGSYGSIYWAPYYKELFPEANVVQFGDSGAGIITQDFFKHSFTKWNATKEVADWIPAIDPKKVNWHHLKLNDVYTAIGDYYPGMRTSQYNTAYDEIQTFFYEIMEGDPEKWHNLAYDSMNTLVDSSAEYRHYWASGGEHCILPYDSFYKVETDGVLFKDWFNELIIGNPVINIDCGADCDPDGVDTTMPRPW